MVQGVAWAEGGCDQAEANSTIGGIIGLRSGNVGCKTKAMAELCRKFRAAAAVPEGGSRHQTVVLLDVIHG
jgi:hypothetical protein